MNLKEALELYHEDFATEGIPVKNVFLTTMRLAI